MMNTNLVFKLAIVVLREQVLCLSAADRDDFDELWKILMSIEDEEEFQSALVAACEILGDYDSRLTELEVKT